MNDVLLKFNGIIDEEIEAYEALSELYQLKQSALVQGQSDALWDIDAQIIEKAKNIKELNGKRKVIAGYLGDENLTLSGAIEKAKAANDDIAEKLEAQKTKINIITKTLMLQENTNMTLVKHGLTMVGKTLDIIVGIISPQTQG
ncbi:MAG: flagellar export chaperone FlgN, partial [Candidatus Gastranaerophilales bacterium]|nr:flagellar export chaperone FlgN [Candidatus Gastranaerophilales bacterium]